MTETHRLSILRIGLMLLVAHAAHAQTDMSLDVVDSVVRIEVRNPGGTEIGAGFFISPAGEIATAYHVIEGAKRIYVRTNYGHGEARVTRFDETKDLAVLTMAPLGRPWPYLEIGEPPVPLRGVRGVAIGHPGNKLNFSVPVFFTRDSIPSEQWSIGGTYPFREVGLYLLPLDGTIEQGMSGGPIIVRGKVVGVVSGSERGTGFGEFGWAIPAHLLQTLKRPEPGMTLPEQKLLHASARQRTRALLKSQASTELDNYAVLRSRIVERSAALGTVNARIDRAALETKICVDKLQNLARSGSPQDTITSQFLSCHERSMTSLQENMSEIQQANAIGNSIAAEASALTQFIRTRGTRKESKSKGDLEVLNRRASEFSNVLEEEQKHMNSMSDSLLRSLGELKKNLGKARTAPESLPSEGSELLRLTRSTNTFQREYFQAHLRLLFANLGYLSNVREMYDF